MCNKKASIIEKKREMSTDYQKYDYFSVGNTPEELKSAVINNCTSCDVGEDDNDCLELMTQDHLINDAKDLLVHNHYMRALDGEKPKKRSMLCN